MAGAPRPSAKWGPGLAVPMGGSGGAGGPSLLASLPWPGPPPSAGVPPLLAARPTSGPIPPRGRPIPHPAAPTPVLTSDGLLKSHISKTSFLPEPLPARPRHRKHLLHRPRGYGYTLRSILDFSFPQGQGSPALPALPPKYTPKCPRPILHLRGDGPGHHPSHLGSAVSSAPTCSHQEPDAPPPPPWVPAPRI